MKEKKYDRVITFWVSEEMLRRVKMAAFNAKKTVSCLLREAIEEKLKKIRREKK